MNELITLEASLRELLAKLDLQTCPLILGGGYGLYLRRTILRRDGTRTLLDHWPEARSTNDLDSFLRPELMCDSSRLETLKSALDELGYEPVKGAEHYQFRKEDLAGFIERGIKIELLTGPSSSFDGSGLRIDDRRVQPQPSVGVHAHPTDEAITLAENLQQVDLESNSTVGDLRANAREPRTGATAPGRLGVPCPSQPGHLGRRSLDGCGEASVDSDCECATFAKINPPNS